MYLVSHAVVDGQNGHDEDVEDVEFKGEPFKSASCSVWLLRGAVL